MKNKITIDENFYIKPDSFCWMLVMERNTGEIHEKTKKEIITRDRWYCTSIKECLRRYANEVTKPSTSYDDLMVRLEQVEQTIKDLKV